VQKYIIFYYVKKIIQLLTSRGVCNILIEMN